MIIWADKNQMISSVWDKYQNRELENVLKCNKEKEKTGGSIETFNWIGTYMFFPCLHDLPSENPKEFFEEIKEPYSYNASFILEHLLDFSLIFNTNEFGLRTCDTIIKESLTTFAPYSNQAVLLMEKMCNLQRFLIAQNHIYNQALQEIKHGKKESHWMWYIFPQMKGLGSSAMSDTYSINNRFDAKAYIVHPILRERLIEVYKAILDNSKTVYDIFGDDTIKVRSCALLFASVSNETVFKRIISKYSWK